LTADLHFHSSCSDGSDSPTALAALIAKLDLHYVALTDHDSVAGLEEFLGALGPSQTAILGTEISVEREKGTLHVLLYGSGLMAPEFREILANLSWARATRNADIIDKARSMGLDITLEQVLAQAGTQDPYSKSVGRPHIAAVLVDHGYASSIRDAFDRYLAKGQSLYRSRVLLDLETVTQLAAHHGLAAVVAHPDTLGLTEPELDSFLEVLSTAGFSGLEAYYGTYSPALRRDLAALAAHHGLVATGGSDYHGSYKPDIKLGTGNGDLAVPDSAGEELLARIAALESSK